ncbi:MAG: TIGR02206 family membrane protein [Verrucomicrobia bacterium]|nr:MAG: TIGR02206 family membrane protein [Verrucomicrobiota bacterium]
MSSAPRFHPYGPAHLCVIFLTITLPFALATLVRWTKSSLTERIVVGMLSLVLVLNYLVYLSLVRQFGAVTWEQLLPMQLCDWAMVVVIISMWTRRPRWFEVAYFWGIGGTVQAVLTPNLPYGFPDFRFFSFFISHCGIIIGIIFLMLRHHLRPWGFSIARVFLWTELYFILTLAADEFTGFNYGFLLHKPEAQTLLNLLSDNRPLYLVEMHLLALAFFIVLYLPFVIYDLASQTVSHKGHDRTERS